MNDFDDPWFDAWMESLEDVWFTLLTFPELRRGLQALSTWYVEQRRKMKPGTPFSSQGKRGAFALFYGPMHLILIRRIVRELDAAWPAPEVILDLGCGTGAAGAAWAIEAARRPRLSGVELNEWAAGDARWTWQRLGLRGTARTGDLKRRKLTGKRSAIVLAYTVNELSEADRKALLERLIVATRKGARVLIVEPISRRISPWWDEWAAALAPRGGRADTWRFACDLPEPLARLDKAAGLNHRELTARSLYVPPPASEIEANPGGRVIPFRAPRGPGRTRCPSGSRRR